MFRLVIRHVAGSTPSHSQRNGATTAANVHAMTSHARSAIAGIDVIAASAQQTRSGVSTNGLAMRVNRIASENVTPSTTGTDGRPVRACTHDATRPTVSAA